MARAVSLPIHRAHPLMRRADRLLAGGAPRHFVHPDQLVAPTLATPQTGGAQAAASLGGVRTRLLSVAAADRPPTARARPATRRPHRASTPPPDPPPFPAGRQ